MDDGTDDSWARLDTPELQRELEMIRVNLQMCLDTLLAVQQRLSSP